MHWCSKCKRNDLTEDEVVIIKGMYYCLNCAEIALDEAGQRRLF